MDERRTEAERQPTEPEPTDSWQEVGEQLRLLGSSLAEALRAAWESEANRRRLQSLEEGLESLANELGEAVKGVASTPEAERVRVSAEKVAETARDTGGQVLEEVRPHLTTALRQLNRELSALIRSLESEEKGPPAVERIEIGGPAPDSPVTPVRAVEAPLEPEEAEETEEAPTEEEPPSRSRLTGRGGRPVAEVDPDPWWWAWSRRR